MSAVRIRAGDVVSLADVVAASKRLEGHALATPLLRSLPLNDLTGAQAFLKAEIFQRTGSFKFRGAWNRMTLIPETERVRGVVAYSLGNHAQGVAEAARILGIPATIVMPNDAAPVKIARTRALGARVLLFDRRRESSHAIIGRIENEEGVTHISSCDEEAVIAGQGTVGLEMIRQVQDVSLAFDDVLVCCGCGGLTAGIATAFGELSPATRIWAVEPADFDDTARSLAAGRRVANPPGMRSICDALLAAEPGALNFEINRRRLAGALTVGDDEVRDAMRFAMNTLKLVVEPGGAAALAALLTGKIDARGRVVGVVLTGGNVDAKLLAEVLAEGAP
jgi:threonine dehydratase